MSQLLPAGLRRRVAAVAPDAVVRRGRRVLQGESRPQRSLRQIGDRLSRRKAARVQRAVDPSSPGLVPVAVTGHWTVGRVVDRFRADEVYAEQAAAVADALEAHGVDYFYLSTTPHRRRVLVVPASRRIAALRALESELADAAFYLAPLYGRALQRARPLGGRAISQPGPGVRLFQVLATADGTFLSGSEMGADLQFWAEAGEGAALSVRGEPLTPGSLVGERSLDPTPEVVEPMASSVITRSVDERPRPTLAELTFPHLLDVVDPIDVVYTWVDGGDPAWQQRMHETLDGRAEAGLHALAANASRYTSRDELRYSLRSLEMYAGWVRHIYVVTDGQLPGWLATDHPDLTVVSHAELFGDRGRLPTFNSHAIESQLHHIDGLAENYLYLNDDVFLGRPVTPELFVLGNGLARFFLSSVKVTPGPVRPGDLPITSAAKNNRDLLLEKFGRVTTHKFQHAPYSLRRSTMFELEDLFADQVAATAASQFRSPTDLSISAALGHYYAFLTGRAVPGRLHYTYADIARPDTPERLETLLRKRGFDAFCLNDHDSSQLSQEAADAVAEFLRRYFPLPSRFERTDPGAV